MHDEPDSGLGRVAAMLLGVTVIGTLGYWQLEGWSLLDSLYMTVITLTTIGYGEVRTLDTTGRLFTIVLCVGGLGVAAYAFSSLTASFIEGRISESLRRRRIRLKIENLKDHYIIVGGGSTGTIICEELEKLEHPFVVVEHEEDTYREIRDRGWLAVHGDALKDEVLERAGIKQARGVFCVLHDDPSNVFVVLTARVLNPKIQILSELHDDDSRQQLQRAGVDGIVNSGYIGGLRMVSQMIRPAAVSFLDAMIRDRSSDYRFSEIRVPTTAQGRTIREICPAKRPGALVLSIQEAATQEFRINPSRDTAVKPDDVLIVLGNSAQLKEMRQTLKVDA